MAEEDQDQKTEYPTGKRLQEAREKGQLPVSREIGYLTSFIGIYIVVKWLAPGMAMHLIAMLRVFIESPHAFTVDDHGLQSLVFDTLAQVSFATVLVFVVMVAAIIAGYMVQTGFFASTQLIMPDFSRFSLIKGLKKFFSVQSGVELIKSFAKLLVLGLAAFFTLWPLITDLPDFVGKPLMDSVLYLHTQAVHLLIVLLAVFMLIALGDLMYQRYSYIKNLKMTKTEVKDEHKDMEGDPAVKSRLRQIRMDRARRRMMAQVPKADVVITNPTHYAVALQYDSEKNAAPVVLAKGLNRIAERIREVAEEHKVTLVSNPPLARALYDTVEIDEEIPAQHYKAVAEIISYVYKLRKKRG